MSPGKEYIMLLTVDKSKETQYSEGDNIVIFKNNKFVGFSHVVTQTDNAVVIDADNNVRKMMNELQMESIPYDFKLM